MDVYVHYVFILMTKNFKLVFPPSFVTYGDGQWGRYVNRQQLWNVGDCGASYRLSDRCGIKLERENFI